MATMENFRTRLARAQARAAGSGRVELGTGMLSKCIQAGIYFLSAAVLAGGRIFGGCAPFGLALVGGAGSGANAAAALAGASLGYLNLLGMVDGLRYVSAAILTFSVAFAFYDVKLYRLSWTMPLVAAVMNACTGFIYLSHKGWRAQDVVCFLLEVLLTAAGAYAFRAAFRTEGQEDDIHRRMGLMLLMAAVLICLSDLYIFADISAGRIAAGVVVLCCGWQGGWGAGAAAGVIFGLAMDLSEGGQVLYAASFGVAGLASGMVPAPGKLRAAVAFALGSIGAVLWLWGSGLPVSALYETAAACLLFTILPAGGLRRLGAQLIREEPVAVDDRVRAYVCQRLEGTARAFRAVHEALRSAFMRPPVNDADTAAVFDRAAGRVCGKCTLRNVCWERDYVTTFNALNDATQAMLDRGRGEPGDFPAYFSSRCIHFPDFLGAVNEELTALLYRRQYNSRIRESRQAVCRQYGQLSDLLSAAAAELGQELTPDPGKERRLRQHLAVLGVEAEGAVFYDREHRLRVEISGPGCRRLDQEKELADLAALMGCSMRREDTHARDRLILVQSEPYMAVAGIAAGKKDGETVSGDAGTWFKRPDGRLYVLLCDGMGSGVQAHRESGLAVRLLEQFLKAGMETEHALSVLNSALALRGEDEGGFTTVDLLEVDLFSAEAAVFKYGAAPTYVRKKDGVQRIAGSSLPAGMTGQANSRPDCTRLHLEQGDCVVMVSDGVCPAWEDSGLRERLAAFQWGSPKDLARELVEAGQEKAADDRTAVVIRLLSRDKETVKTAQKALTKEEK